MVVESRPFDGLSPDRVLAAVAACGFEPDGRLFALNSYENRVYQVGTSTHGTLVLKFYRPARWSDAQIREEHAFTLELASHELPVAAPLEVEGKTLLRHEGFRFAAFRFMRGHAPELDASGALEQLGRTIGRLHGIGATHTFEARPRLDAERLGHRPIRQVLESRFVPAGLEARYEHAARELLAEAETALARVGDLRLIRIHGDCHLGNVLWNEQGPLFVDLDDCVMGPRVQDLWMFLSGDSDEQRRRWAILMGGYEQFADFDYREVRLIEALRALRMLHQAGWVAERWNDPAFPRTFPWYGEPRFWETYVTDLSLQREAIAVPPLLG
jgi:Ser/Thr protein kinase RdoA (MazF antagonist)